MANHSLLVAVWLFVIAVSQLRSNVPGLADRAAKAGAYLGTQRFSGTLATGRSEES